MLQESEQGHESVDDIEDLLLTALENSIVAQCSDGDCKKIPLVQNNIQIWNMSHFPDNLNPRIVCEFRPQEGQDCSLAFSESSAWTLRVTLHPDALSRTLDADTRQKAATTLVEHHMPSSRATLERNAERFDGPGCTCVVEKSFGMYKDIILSYSRSASDGVAAGHDGNEASSFDVNDSSAGNAKCELNFVKFHLPLSDLFDILVC